MYKPLLYLGNLDGPDGNAFAILAKAKRVATQEGMDFDAIRKEATSGDYEHLLDTMRKYFDAQVMESVRTTAL